MTDTTIGDRAGPSAQDEVVELCRDLLQIDSSNYGDGSGSGERTAAEYVAGKLSEVGLDPVILESAPRRTSVIVRIPGTDPNRDALLVHGHLDVVPAQASDWQLDPFAGEELDGCLWGRGAVDMKDMDAMMLAVFRQRIRDGRPPARDVVLAFMADEEAGGLFGSHWLVDNHRELFEGCTEAISEVGGFSLTLPNERRLYLIETAQKGMAWMRLTAAGRAGHGSMINEDNAVTALCAAVARVGSHRFPIRVTKTVQRFLEEISDELGIALDPNDMEATVARLGPLAALIGATTRSTVNPTMLAAGYKHNVIPGQATAAIDGRFLPGHEEEFLAELDTLLGADVTREFEVHDIAVETEYDGAVVDAICAALELHDPGSRAVPYMNPAGTDAKAFSTLGIRNFGFVPLRLPPELDFAGMFHGVDERVPIDGLRFGTRVLDHFLDVC